MTEYSIHAASCGNILLEKGMNHSETADIALVEKGEPLPDKEICVVFDPGSVDRLIRFLSQRSDLSSGAAADLISCRDGERIKLVKTEQIEYFSASGNDVYCYIQNNEVMEVKKRIYELEQILGGKGFFRVNKSTLVNIREIKDISPWFGGKLLLRMKNGTDEIEVSRRFVGDFKEYLGV